MKQLFKTSLGFTVVLSSLATTVTAQTLEEVVVTAQKREQADYRCQYRYECVYR